MADVSTSLLAAVGQTPRSDGGIAEYERKARDFEKVVKERDLRINEMQTSLNYKEDILNSLSSDELK
jgi:hypothetical protein